MGSRDHTLTIAAALRELERRLELPVQALSHESAPVSVEHARTEREARRLVCEAYATIDYAPDDRANESHVCLGVIGGSAAKVALRELQRSDLSLLTAYRQIPVLTRRVKRVAYTRAVYRKDRAAITALL